MEKYYTFKSNGTINAIYFQDIKYALIRRSNYNYVACYRPYLVADEQGVYFTEWEHGHYFGSIEHARAYITDILIEKANELLEEASDIHEQITLFRKKENDYDRILCNTL